MQIVAEITPSETRAAGTAVPRYTVQVARTISEVEALRPLWTSMQWHPNSDIDFYLDVLRSRPEFLRPHVMVVHRGGRPEAMLLGRVEDRVLDLRIGYGSLVKPKVRLLAFGYGGVLGNPSAEGSEEAVRRILGSLRAGEADLAFFNHLRADSPVYAQVVRLSGALTRDYFPDLRIHRSMALPKTFGQLYAALSPKTRKSQRWNKFRKDFGDKIRIDSLRETADLERVFRDVEDVARRTYQRGLGVGFADTPEMRARLRLVAEKGWLRTFILYVGEKPCAFWVGIKHGCTLHSDSMGYDPDYAKYSPGMFLVIRAIEDLFDHRSTENVEEIDFGLGDAEYKEALCNREWQDASVYIFAPTLRAVGLNLLRTPTVFINQFGRKALERTQLLRRVKKAWRSRLAK